MAASPNGMLRHATFGASGMAGADVSSLSGAKFLKIVAIADVDRNRAEGLKKRFPEANVYQDWRVLLDK